VDTALSIGRDFGATSDLDKANRGRNAALNDTQQRIKQRRREANANAIKASTTATGDIEDQFASYQRPDHYETNMLTNSKYQPQRSRSDTTGSVVGDYQPTR